MKCDRKKKYEADALACERLQETVEPLVEWFRENQRDLPWRKHVNAYRVWISEIMLQQTRVEAVKSYYTRFLEELPWISKRWLKCRKTDCLSCGKDLATTTGRGI